MRNWLLLTVLLLLFLNMKGQETDHQKRLLGEFISMPPELFAKNIKDHKVRSVQKVSPAGRDGADKYLEFDSKGRLVWYGSRSVRSSGAAMTYDDKGRITGTSSTNGSGRWMSRTMMVYDSVYEQVVVRQHSLDSSGRLILVSSVTAISVAGDTTLYITKNLVRSGPGGEELETIVKREVRAADTLYVFKYRIDPDMKRVEKDEIGYRIYTNGVLRQEGGSVDEPRSCESCCPPAGMPFIESYLKIRDARIEAWVKKEHPEYVEELKRVAEERKKKGLDSARLAAGVCYQYDSAGRLSDKVFGGGQYKLHYTYDAQGHLIRAQQTPGKISKEFYYDAQGLLTGYTESDKEIKLEYTFY